MESINEQELSYKELEQYNAQQFIKFVHEDLLQIKQPHFDIAFRLEEANFRFYYSVLGYKDIYELAEQEFSLGKTSTKNYIAVAKSYMAGKSVGSRWTHYSFTQLVEMLAIDVNQRQSIKPEWTIRQIRDWKRDHKLHELPDGSVRMYGDMSPAERKQIAESSQNAHAHTENTVGQSTDHTENVQPDMKNEFSTIEPVTATVIATAVSTATTNRLNFKNTEERKAFLDSYTTWALWVDVPELGIKVYRYNLITGDSLLATEYYESNPYNDHMRMTHRYQILPQENGIYDFRGIADTYILDWLRDNRKDI